MGLLDDVRRAMTGEDPAATQRVAASAFQYASVVLDPDYQELYKHALLPWIQRMSQTVPSKWFHPRVQRACGVESVKGKCSVRAAGMCCLCQRDVCLAHAFVNVDGSLLCAQCVATARKYVDVVVNSAPTQAEYDRAQQAAPKPGKDKLAEAYRLLGVTEDIDTESIQTLYKSLLRKNHPDRAKTAGDKSIAEAKFKAIRNAHDTIMAARKNAA
jgi:DnaJ domain